MHLEQTTVLEEEEVLAYMAGVRGEMLNQRVNKNSYSEQRVTRMKFTEYGKNVKKTGDG